MSARKRHLVAFWVTALLMGLAALFLVVPNGKFFLVGGVFSFDSWTDYLVSVAAYSLLLTMICFVPLGWVVDRFGDRVGRSIMLVPILVLVLGVVIFFISAKGGTLPQKISSPAMRWAFYPFFFVVYCGMLFLLKPASEIESPTKTPRSKGKKRRKKKR